MKIIVYFGILLFLAYEQIEQIKMQIFNQKSIKNK